MNRMAATPGIDDGTLALRLATLELENGQLRGDLAASLGLAASLREANEHLVLAAVDAQTSRDDAEETNRRQNEFLAMLAHELRNPLVPISVSASLLERSAAGAGAGTLDRLAGVIQRQVGHMARLLDDLLDAARLSSGKITLAIEPLRLAELIEHAVETVMPRVRERSQELAIAPVPDTLVVEGDRVRLTQVFTNLLSNASKYTQDGGRIAVAAHAAAAADAISVTIDDNGSGMSDETISRAFDLFTQGPRSLARSEGGLGVGLNVVRNLVTMHGGSVSAASPGLGQGSTFAVHLQLSGAEAGRGAVRHAAPVVGAARRILIVEDNADASDVMRMLLEVEGHQVEIAGDGNSGLALALEGRFDAIVCDIGLPGLDGLELMARLRAAPTGTRPLAIALSGYGQPQDRERALAAGFDRYLVKPVAPGVLIELLAGMIPTR